MKRFFRGAFLIAIFMMVLMVNSAPLYAETPQIGNTMESDDVVLLTDPPKGLTAAKGDGKDETAIIQNIFDYATANHKTVVIPENHTFVVDRIVIFRKNNFSVQGDGTLKHKSGATRALFHINYCKNFTIKSLHTDGNVDGIGSVPDAFSQDIHSVEIMNSQDFILKNIVDKNPVSDSLYLNNVANVRVGTVTATSEKPCGRNGLTIIKAQNVTIYWIKVHNIGSGIVFEPNYSTDNIQNVVIKSAVIRTSYGGLAVINQHKSIVKDIVINGEITKAGTTDPYIFRLHNIKNFAGKIKITQEGSAVSTAARITGCNNVRINLQVYNAINGIDLGQGSSQIYLTGKILRTTGDGISIWEGLTDSIIDMEIKNVGNDGQHGAVQISYWGSVENVLFKGDYSYSGSGKYCFCVDGKTNNCRAQSLNRKGWGAKNCVIGRNPKGLNFY